MARHVGPRVNTIAHKIICRLVDLGGKATRATLMPMLESDQQTAAHFQSKVVHVLERYGFVIAGRESLSATPAGKNYVGAFLERTTPAAPKYVGQIATSRTAVTPKPLNLNKHMSMMPVRDGSLDFLSLPSVMGKQRIVRYGKQQYR